MADKKGKSPQPERENVGNSSGEEEEEDDTLGTIERIRQYVVEKLGFRHDSADEPKVLDEVSIDGIIKYMEDKNCKNIVTMAGAGISTSSGIPDFRSPGSGLYHNLEKYKLPYPQAIFEISFFRVDPKPFFTLAKELYPGQFKPTVCHYFIRLLHEKGLLLRHYTQNIDTLERVAGLPEEKLVEAHGTFYTSHCIGCHKEFPLSWMKEHIFSDKIPTCDKCNSTVKPDIVFFGENMPRRFLENVDSDFSKCDLLIVMGSSLTVQPFASLIDRVPKTCPRLLLNRQKAGQQDYFSSLFGMTGGMDFDSDTNSRDVLWLGDCDDGCQLLADKLKWGDELRELVKLEHDKIDKAQAQNDERRGCGSKTDKK